MANDFQTLLSEGACFIACGNASATDAVKLALLARIASGGMFTPCTTPGNQGPISIASANATTIEFTVNLSNPNPDHLVVKWGTTAGGPYPNSKTFPSIDEPLTVTTADGLVANTTYYFVFFGLNGFTCLSAAASNEVSGGLQAGLLADWVARINAAGGATPSQSTLNAAGAFINTLVAAGLDSAWISLCCHVPDNLIAAITPILRTAGPNSWTNHNFLLADLTVNGLKGNGTTKFLDTGCVPIVVYPTDASAGMTVYVTSIAAGESKIDMGVQDGGVNDEFDLYCNFATQCGITIWTTPTFAAGNLALNTTAGYCSGNLASGTNTQYFANSTTPHAAIGAHAPAGGRSTNGFPVFVFASNVTGTATSLSAKRFFASGLNFGFTAAQSLTVFNAMKTFLAAVGGTPP